MKYQLTVFHGRGLKKFSYIPQKIVSVCFGGVKTTETGILHEILTNSFSWGGLKNFLYPPKKLLVSVLGGQNNGNWHIA